MQWDDSAGAIRSDGACAAVGFGTVTGGYPHGDVVRPFGR